MLRSTGKMLLENGYKLRVIDLIDFSKSDSYNPFVYIRDDKDVLKLINTIIVNTTPKDASKNDPFWERSETALLQALMFYLWYKAPKDEQNLGTLIDMLEYAAVDEEQRSQVTPLDLLFEALEYEEPEHIAVKQYKIYKQAAAKTAKTINVTIGTRLSSFNISQIRKITNTDDMNIPSIGEEKTAVFAVISDNDSTFNYIIGMLYTCARKVNSFVHRGLVENPL